MSRVAVEIVVVVLLVAILLIAFSPMGSFVMDQVRRVSAAWSPGYIQVMGGGIADRSASYVYFVVYMRNIGPAVIGDPSKEITEVILSPTNSETEWLAYVNGVRCTPYCSNPDDPNRCSVRQHIGASMGLNSTLIHELETNGAMEVYEVWEFGVRCENTDALVSADRYKIQIYGPSGARAYYLLEEEG
ncbi:MAG TPA: hypothetical protein ENG69_01730 [Candidatus Korarchaeota archaeon]|nr:hypothetical protein [Candidatus Korarchaeota archaeon]